MPSNSFENPYAVPQASNPYAVPQASNPDVVDQPFQEIYRSGNYLVMYKRARLPDRCVKSNLPTTEKLKRNLYWHHPLIYLLILIHILLYVIVALIVRKSATIQLPLSPKYKSRRLMWMLLAWLTFFLSIAVIVLAIAFGNGNFSWLVPASFVSFPILLLTAGLIGIFGCRVVYAKRIEGDFVKIGGVSPDFLSGLPEFPYPI